MKLNPNSSIQFRTTIPPFLFALALASLAFLPSTQAVSPPPDGGYPGFNTAEGQDALLSLDTSTGLANTAIGWFSLKSNVDGGFNTAVGAGTLVLNSGAENTAVGAAALLLNTTGSGNTAVGSTALVNNAGGEFNTATGTRALQGNTSGGSNTANGVNALFSSTEGGANTAIGTNALEHNTTGSSNTAVGLSALFSNTSGNLNVAIGYIAGAAIDGSNNVCIGAGVSGAAGVNDTTWIKNVYSSVATERIVYVNSDGKLGTLASSRRFKDEIKPMDKTSETILALKPVTFRYKQEIDSSRIPQFGLVAEDVAKVNPDLVVRDKNGEIYSVRYEAVNAMLLNEFLKAHRRIEKQDKRIDQLTAQLKEQALLIQRVNDKVELNRPVPQTVANDQ